MARASGRARATAARLSPWDGGDLKRFVDFRRDGARAIR